MELDELKKNWQQSTKVHKSQTQLDKMTQIENHPKLKRIRFKLIFEAVLITGFILIYYSALDGADKPLWANVTLISSALLFIISDLIGYTSIHRPIKGNNLHLSIRIFSKNLKRTGFLSILSTLFFGGSIILFMVSNIELTETKQPILSGMIITLVAMTYLSYKNWLLRFKSIESTLKDLEV